MKRQMKGRRRDGEVWEEKEEGGEVRCRSGRGGGERKKYNKKDKKKMKKKKEKKI